MEDEVTRLPSLPRRDSSSLEDSPPVVPLVPLDKEVNIMTQDDLDYLKESCLIPSSIQIRLPKAGETIESARPGEVAFYEAAFHAGLRFPIHFALLQYLPHPAHPQRVATCCLCDSVVESL